MRIAGIDAATNQNVEITALDQGLRLATPSASIDIPNSDITEFAFESGSAGSVLRLDGAVSMRIIPADPEAARFVVDGLHPRNRPAATPAGGLFDGPEPIDTEVEEVEDTSGYCAPEPPPSNAPAGTFEAGPPPQRPLGPVPVTSNRSQLFRSATLLSGLMLAAGGIVMIGAATIVARTLAVGDADLSAIERLGRFLTTTFLTAAAFSLTAGCALLLRLTAGINDQTEASSLPLIGPMTSALERARQWHNASGGVVLSITALGTMGALITAATSLGSAALWMTTTALSVAWLLSLTAGIEQMRSQLDGSINLWEGRAS